METAFDLTPILNILVTLISAIVTGLLIPLIKKRLSNESCESLKFWVKIAVAAAEQLYGSKAGKEKREYVVGFLLSKGIVVDVDEVNAIIESEVYKLGNKI